MARLKRLVMAQLPHLVQQRVVAGGADLTDPVDQQAYLVALRHCCDEHEVAVIAYALLTHMMARATGLRAGEIDAGDETGLC